MRPIYTLRAACLVLILGGCSGDKSDGLSEELGAGNSDAGAGRPDAAEDGALAEAGAGELDGGKSSGDAGDDPALDGSASDAAPPSGDYERVAELALGSAHGCAQMVDGRIKCWGSNSAGQLGRGDADSLLGRPGGMGPLLEVVQLGSEPVVQLSAGGDFSCVRFDSGQVKCWGRNNQGQLGQDDTANVGSLAGEPASLPPIDLGPGRSARFIAQGSAFACALLDDDSVKCWGANDQGQLGQGDTLARGDEPGEMAALAPVDLGSGRTAKQLLVGAQHACALRDDDALVCWGYNVTGALGRGELTSTGPLSRIGDDAGEMGDALATFSLGAGRTVESMAGGFGHSCALLDGGRLKCWGYNAAGQLGLGDEETRGDAPGELGDDLPEVTFLGDRQVVQVAARRGSCAVLDDGALVCWGDNSFGQLGVGDEESRGNQPGPLGDAVPLGTDRRAVKVALSTDASACAILDDERVKCWGEAGGPLFDQMDGNVGDVPGELADALPYLDLGRP